jgi:hypothetical protein
MSPRLGQSSTKKNKIYIYILYICTRTSRGGHADSRLLSPQKGSKLKKMIKRSKHINLSKKQFKTHQVIQKFSTILPLKSGYHSRLEQPCLRRRAKERRCHQLHPGRYANVDIAHSYVHICYIQWIGSRKIYKNPAIFLWNMRVSCRFSPKPIHWYIYIHNIYIYIQYIYIHSTYTYAHANVIW